VAEERVHRRLAAILAADVAGYSRLMGADEVGTLAAMKAHRREVVDPAIASHNGRIVKTTGDGMLVEFASAVGAVNCAMGVQGKMADRNGSAAQTITFRIGINVDDIIIDGDDIFGDGVNVAARVENECQPGGVCLWVANWQIWHESPLWCSLVQIGPATLFQIPQGAGPSKIPSTVLLFPSEAKARTERPFHTTHRGHRRDEAPQSKVRLCPHCPANQSRFWHQNRQRCRASRACHILSTPAGRRWSVLANHHERRCGRPER
jgi:hypothetical protein